MGIPRKGGGGGRERVWTRKDKFFKSWSWAGISPSRMLVSPPMNTVSFLFYLCSFPGFSWGRTDIGLHYSDLRAPAVPVLRARRVRPVAWLWSSVCSVFQASHFTRKTSTSHWIAWSSTSANYRSEMQGVRAALSVSRYGWLHNLSLSFTCCVRHSCV